MFCPAKKLLYRTCTASKKKLRLKSSPLSTYLFVVVMRILLPQYARIGMTGLLAAGGDIEGPDGAELRA